MVRAPMGLSAVVLTAFMAAPLAAEVKSGLPEGSRVGAFNVHDVTGPSAGQSLCYR